MAIGAGEYGRRDAYGQEPNVCTAMELEEALKDGQPSQDNRVVAIQCVGSER